MPEYRRAFEPGGIFFFTVVSHQRRRFLRTPMARTLLRQAIREVMAAAPFEMTAIILLPDHLHAIWQLPDDDGDFSTRWGRIKKGFTDRWLRAGGGEETVTVSRRQHRERGVWQRRFWEHVIRDKADMIAHLDYIHYNPIKHGLATCPHAWPYSSFHRYVRQGQYERNWQCSCDDRRPIAPGFDSLNPAAME